MKVTTQIVFKEYLKLQYLLTYRKPRTIIYLIVSLFVGLIFISQLINGDSLDDSWYGLLILAYMLLLPLIIYITAKKNFDTYAAIQDPVTYEFLRDKMIVTRENGYAELAWSKVYKVVEYNNWFLIYQSNRLANLIPKKTSVLIRSQN